MNAMLQVDTELFRVTFADGSYLEVPGMDECTARVAACIDKWGVTGNYPTVKSVEKVED